MSPQLPTFPVFYAENSGYVKGLWLNFEPTMSGSQVYFASSMQAPLGITWSTPIVSSPLMGFPANGGGSVDQQGNTMGLLALTTSNESQMPPYNIQMVAMAHDATEWTMPYTLGVDNTATSGPAVFGTVSSGVGLMGWRQDSPLRLKTARYDFSNVIVELNDLVLPLGTTDIGFVAGSLAPSGDAVMVIALQNGEGSNYVLYSSFLPNESSTWTYPEMVSDPSNNTGGNMVSVKTDNDGNAVIVWGELTPGGTPFIRAGRLPFGDTLTSVVNLTSPTAENTTFDPQSALNVSFDKFGNAVAIWELNIDGAHTVQVASNPKSAAWSTPQTLSTTGFFPRVALSNQGKGEAIWLDSASSMVYGSTNAHLFPLNSPSGFAGYFSQAPGTDYYLNVHWTPSQAPNVVNYQIFRDDELVASVSGSSTTYILLLDCRELDGDYTLVAVGSNGNKSNPIPFTLTQ